MPRKNIKGRPLGSSSRKSEPMSPTHRQACVDHYVKGHSIQSLAELLVDLEHKLGFPPAVDIEDVE